MWRTTHFRLVFPHAWLIRFHAFAKIEAAGADLKTM